MAYAMAHSNTDVIQLGEAYKACASTATSLGYSVEETTAVLATMANAGVKGGEAGTALNAIFTRLATNTKECGDTLAEYGVQIYDAHGNMQSLSSILTGMAGIWDTLTDQEQANLAKVIAGTNQYSKLQTIMAGCSEAAAEGGQSFADYTAALNDCAGSADKMAGTMLDNMNGRLTLMQSAADGLKIAIGEDLTPVMSDLYDVGAEVLGWMQGFVEENPGVVKGIAAGTVTLGGLVGTLTAVSAGIKLAHAAATLFTGSLAGLAGPLTLASVAIAGTVTLVTALATSADATVPSVKELTSAARDMGDSMEEASASYDSTCPTWQRPPALRTSTSASWRPSRPPQMGTRTEMPNTTTRWPGCLFWCPVLQMILTLRPIPSRAAPQRCASTRMPMWRMPSTGPAGIPEHPL